VPESGVIRRRVAQTVFAVDRRGSVRVLLRGTKTIIVQFLVLLHIMMVMRNLCHERAAVVSRKVQRHRENHHKG
jgi:hypothetical protein